MSLCPCTPVLPTLPRWPVCHASTLPGAVLCCSVLLHAPARCSIPVVVYLCICWPACSTLFLLLLLLLLLAEYPAQWLNIRVRLSATALDGDMVGHRDTFIQWGDFVFASLPDVASWHAEAAEQEQAAGQLDDVFQKYGEAEMRADIMEGGFRQSGLEVDSLLKTLQELEM